MKMTTLAFSLTALITAVPAAFAGPDFVTSDRAKPLAASDAHREEQPQDDVVFDYDSAALSDTSRLQLRSVAHWLYIHPRASIVLEGHADSTGPRHHNADLASRRALATRQHLTSIGVAPDRIVVALYGENRARVPADRWDRRVKVFATTLPMSQLVAAELDRDALEVSWTQNHAAYHESRGITPVASIAKR
jgi:outer membrane protein OmpA-like peptidoglycan-associated protein